MVYAPDQLRVFSDHNNLYCASDHGININTTSGSRTNVMEAIQRLVSHLPECVVEELIQKIESQQSRSIRNRERGNSRRQSIGSDGEAKGISLSLAHRLSDVLACISDDDFDVSNSFDINEFSTSEDSYADFINSCLPPSSSMNNLNKMGQEGDPNATDHSSSMNPEAEAVSLLSNFMNYFMPREEVKDEIQKANQKEGQVAQQPTSLKDMILYDKKIDEQQMGSNESHLSELESDSGASNLTAPLTPSHSENQQVTEGSDKKPRMVSTTPSSLERCQSDPFGYGAADQAYRIRMAAFNRTGSVSNMNNPNCRRSSTCTSTTAVSGSGSTGKLRQNRLLSIRCISEEDLQGLKIGISHRHSICSDDGMGSVITNCSADSIEEQLRSNKQKSALLFVDISEFSTIAVSLELEQFSKVINSYFKMIVDEIEACGGDVLKFAGDALIVEWKTSVCTQIHARKKKRRLEETVMMACTCASILVDKCSDVPVVAESPKNVGEKLIAKLNVHCGVGYGNIFGVHVGNNDRMEYIILGDSIRQCAETVNLAKPGQVAVSSEVLGILQKSGALDTLSSASSLSSRSSDNDNLPSYIIASKSERYFKTKDSTPIYRQESNYLERVARRCSSLSMSSLELLQMHMLPYVHAVVFGGLFNGTGTKTSTNVHTQTRRHQSEAELRDVVTLFIQPELSVDLTGQDEADISTCEILNQLMVIVNSEVVRFRGQFRQFIVDDKGVVMIANFGLRGSTFPNMIEERAMPFMKTVKKLLRSELGLECKIGATCGKAYCGFVGATYRHEYAVLGPSVNLAARLMAHKDNPGILVDEEVMKKAGGYPFRDLPAVVAKGYNKPVKIFKPHDSIRKLWNDVGRAFIGRDEETKTLQFMAESTLDSDTCRIVLISGPYGSGKSALLSHSTKQIENLCQKQYSDYQIFRYIFCDDDSFRPFSLVRPLFINMIRHKYAKTSGLDYENLSEEQLYVSFLEICLDSNIPVEYIQLLGGLVFTNQVRLESRRLPQEYMHLLGGLIFTNKLADIGRWSDETHSSEWNAIAMYVVKAVTRCFEEGNNELVLLALDDISGMDEMSWKVLALLYEDAKNLLVIGALRNQLDMNIHPEFWDVLVEDGIRTGKFVHIELSPFDEGDVHQLVGSKASTCCDGKCGEETGRTQVVDKNIVQSVYVQSGGNPLLASEILEKLYNYGSTRRWSMSSDFGRIGEVLLARIDSLSPTARSHLNLAAIMGQTFSLTDMVTVMERYHELNEEETSSLTEIVRRSLFEAVAFGILIGNTEEEDRNDHRDSYSFTHTFWREKILRLTLDGWKNEMQVLIDEARMDENDLPTQDFEEQNADETISTNYDFDNIVEKDVAETASNVFWSAPLSQIL